MERGAEERGDAILHCMEGYFRLWSKIPHIEQEVPNTQSQVIYKVKYEATDQALTSF